MNPDNPQLAPPVFAARLNGLLNTLNVSHTTISGYVKARRELVKELEILLAKNKDELDADEAMFAQVTQHRDEIETRKHEVEMEIMRGLGPSDDVTDASPQTTALDHNIEDEAGTAHSPLLGHMDPPEIEALTPTSSRDNSPAPEVEGAHGMSDFEPARKRRRVDSMDGDDFPDLGQDDGIDVDVAAMLEQK